MAMAGRLSVSLHAWFKKEAFGMTQYEILSRSSACLVRGSARDADASVLALSCLHVVHPFRYPQYYQGPNDDWTQRVTADEVKCTLQVNDAAGAVLEEVALDRHRVVAHPSRDVVALRFDDVQHGLAMVKRHGVRVWSLEDASPVRVGAEVGFSGHRIVPRMQANKDVSVALPHAEAGVIRVLQRVTQSGQDGAPFEVDQTFAETHGATLEQGMCGGPAFVHGDGDGVGGVCGDGGSSALVGIVEGIVSPGSAQQSHIAKQHAAIVEAAQLRCFFEMASIS